MEEVVMELSLPEVEQMILLLVLAMVKGICESRMDELVITERNVLTMHFPPFPLDY